MLIITILSCSRVDPSSIAGIPGKQPVYAFCGAGDNLWNYEVEAVDSPATIDAMFEWMSRTYGITRMYWREESIWAKSYKIGKVDIEVYDYWMNWQVYLYKANKVNETAVKAAKRNNMEIFFYTGLFEHGVQPDTGIICPYIFEDKIRIEHPEWCSLDRWGERRCPGPLSYAYPQVRKLLVDRYAKHVIENGYDGINFYTYVENLGLRYLDEFGFEQPVVDEFNKRYPDVNLCKDTLTTEQKKYWYDCRGKFVTQFLRELHAALAPKGKKISMILDSKEPDYVQPWWGHDIPGTGMIRMDWKTWVNEGIVDELWVQLGETEDQKKTMDLLLKECKGKSLKITLRTASPYASHWAPYVDAGVTPIAVITANVNGIERYSLEATSKDSLKRPDWKLRAQTLDDISTGKLKTDAALVAPLTKDPQVLVRRKAAYALATLADSQFLPALEDELFDKESSVRIAAANALNKFNGPETPQRIMEALQKDSRFQFKIPCAITLGNMKEKAFPVLLAGLTNTSSGVREVCIRALYTLGKRGMLEQVYQPIRSIMHNPKEDYHNQCWAIDSLIGLRMEMNDNQRSQFLADLNSSMHNNTACSTIQIHAAKGLGYMAPLLSAEQKTKTVLNLQYLFSKYGDKCTREDAAFGWRAVGNAMLEYGEPGKAALDAMRVQKQDKWLAWVAYEVMYSVQKTASSFNLVDENDAIYYHNKYAPAFPGWRKW